MNEFQQAAEKATAQVTRWYDDTIGCGVYPNDSFVRKAIIREFAELEATYEDTRQKLTESEETVKKLAHLLLTVIEVCEGCEDNLVPEDKLEKMYWRFDFQEIYKDGMHRLPVKLAKLLREQVDADPQVQAAIKECAK